MTAGTIDRKKVNYLKEVAQAGHYRDLLSTQCNAILEKMFLKGYSVERTLSDLNLRYEYFLEALRLILSKINRYSGFCGAEEISLYDILPTKKIEQTVIDEEAVLSASF